MLQQFPSTETVIASPACYGTLERPTQLKRLPTPDQYAVQLQNVVALPRQILLSGASVLPDSFRRVSPRHKHVALDAVEGRLLPKRPAEPQSVIEYPVYYLDGEHMSHFGHFTLEVLSRLWFWSRYKAASGVRPKVVCSRIEPFVFELLKPFGIGQDDIILLDRPMLLKDVTVASQSFVLECGVAPSAFSVWKTISDFYRHGHKASRIYISRSEWKKQRILLNEPEVEDLFAREGFEIVHPERLSIPDQISMFRDADIVAGPSGSGLYNCVYSVKRGARIILASSKFVTLNDALINSGTQSDIRYITGAPVDDRSGMFAAWKIDLNVLKQQLSYVAKG